MIEKRTKSAIPIYGAAAVFILCSFILPMYKIIHFAICGIITAAAYVILSKIIPDKVTYIEKEPETTGDAQVDALLALGRDNVRSVRSAARAVNDGDVRKKAEKIADLTEKIFAQLADSPENYSQVQRFASYFLPAVLKLLSSYSNLESQGASGENISKTSERISQVLDTTISAYERQLDALFTDEALDIETDIEVMKSMIKNQGLAGSDFDIK